MSKKVSVITEIVRYVGLVFSLLRPHLLLKRPQGRLGET